MNFESTCSLFHSNADAELNYWAGQTGIPKDGKHYIIRDRTLSYRFHVHWHPYVTQLLQRLLRQSTAGLQAADTEYRTRIRLTQTTPATTEGGRKVDLGTDESLDLLHGTTVMWMIDDPAIGMWMPIGLVRFAANKVLWQENEMPVALARDTPVMLLPITRLRRANGQLVQVTSVASARLIDGMPRPTLFEEFFAGYDPNPAAVPNSAESPHPVEDLDFTPEGAYSVYNWELFYHAPLMIAMHLSKNQRFAEAQQWLHFLFDPTDDSTGPTPERFWKVRPFQYTDVQKLEEILMSLGKGGDASVTAWLSAPFRPHAIARFRQQAYMVKTVMAYLDNLIAWGDSLFRQDTGEAIDEALMLYVLAASILGPRPQPVPKKGSVRPQTYANLRADLDVLGNAMREVEADLLFDLRPLQTGESTDEGALAQVGAIGKALYFCTPRNDKLLGYWDTVADRLFKIRNSLNIQGIFRQLPLFEPPIDPALLAKAAAAGLDIGEIVNGLNQPLPLVRFQVLVQKAAEIVQEVKSLGGHLLAEKEDGEAMAILRGRHERAVMEMVEHVKYGQLQEAIKSKEGLLQSLMLAVQRYTFYQRQLGRDREEIERALPKLDEIANLDQSQKSSLGKLKLTLQDPSVTIQEIAIDIAEELGASGGKIISSYEREELTRLEAAQELQEHASALSLIAKVLAMIPEFGAHAQPLGVGAVVQFGGKALASELSFAADAISIDASRSSYEAGKAARIGGYARREQDWAFQTNLAAGEINQIVKQLRAAQIREAVAERELENHRQQMKHAEEIEQFLNADGTNRTGKKTNQAFYAWMKREVKGLYAQCFQLGFDIAKKAERALQHELGNPTLTWLSFGYLAGKEGLLAGEKLYLDIKRMELAYHELNQREYELTKHVSLLQVDPLALLSLRKTGRCTVTIPEALFDMDGPGHYFRRIKSVAVSIPCVVGPYASVNCTLTLLKSSVRTRPTLKDGRYEREGAEDDRFSDYFGSLQSIVTSSGRNDAGLFEANLRDERYLPFEYSGVISEWQLQLPADPSNGDPVQLDYDTISDAILHIRYTAREGGELLRAKALEHQKTLIDAAKAAGSVRLFSIRHEFPTEWAAFKATEIDQQHPAELRIELRRDHFPIWSTGKPYADGDCAMTLLAESKASVSVASAPGNETPLLLQPDSSLGGLKACVLPCDWLETEVLATGEDVSVLRLFIASDAIDAIDALYLAIPNH
jgi:hypothetical protein